MITETWTKFVNEVILDPPAEEVEEILSWVYARWAAWALKTWPRRISPPVAGILKGAAGSYSGGVFYKQWFDFYSIPLLVRLSFSRKTQIEAVYTPMIGERDPEIKLYLYRITKNADFSTKLVSRGDVEEMEHRLRDVVKHEYIHYYQEIKGADYDTPFTYGLPGKQNIKTRQQDYVRGGFEEYFANPTEFYPHLRNEADKFVRDAAALPGRQFIKDMFLDVVAQTPGSPMNIFYYLKKSNPGLYKKAVKLFYTEIMGKLS